MLNSALLDPHARSHRRAPCRRSPVAIAALAACMSGLVPATVLALPQGPQVAAGQVSVKTPTPTSLVLQQSTGKAIIDWTSFSVQSGESVNIVQPGIHSVLLNRVTGTDPSSILGTISANGEVFLVNPRGVVFGAGSQVSVGSLVASTLALSDADFLAGRYAFSADPAGTPGQLEADGRISAPRGTVALISPEMLVKGSVQGARVGLAAVGTTSVDVEGDGLIFFDARNDGLAARLDMLGHLQATGGGTVDIRALARAGFADTVLNLDGVVQARSLGVRDGQIVVDGGSDGIVSVTGQLDASGQGRGETGGTVKLLGQDVGLFGDARIDVSGRTGGGTAIVGGDLHGTGPDPDSKAVFVGQGVHIDADALGTGNGGLVVAWSNESTKFAGTVTARGGASGGDGGFVETSSHDTLAFDGSVDTSAAQGKVGTWLLDPIDIAIVAPSASTPDQQVGLDETAGAFTPKATSTGGTLGTDTIISALDHNNVTITTSGGATPDPTAPAPGTVTISAPLTWTTNHSLTITADLAINVGTHSAISAGGDLTLTAGTDITLGSGVQASGNVAFSAGKSIDVLSGSNIASPGGGNITMQAQTDLTLSADVQTTGVVQLKFGQGNAGNTFKVDPAVALSGSSVSVLGGNGDDNIVLGAGPFLGSVDGGAGNNTLQAANADWHLMAAGSGQLSLTSVPPAAATTSFSNIQTLSTGASAGTLYFTALAAGDSLRLSDGRSGELLVQASGSATWNVLENLKDFTNAKVSGNATTLPATPYQIDASEWAEPITITAAPGAATLTGNSQNTTLLGTTNASVFTVNGTGGSANNTLTWTSASGAQLTTFNNVTTLAGGSGNDALDAPAAYVWTITGAGKGTLALPGTPPTIDFDNVQALMATGSPGASGLLKFTAASPGDSIVLTTTQLQSGHAVAGTPLPLLETLSGFTSASLAGNALTPPGVAYSIDVSAWAPASAAPITATITAAPGTASINGNGSGTVLMGTTNPSLFTLKGTDVGKDSTLAWKSGVDDELTTFNNVGTLAGGSDQDTFAISAGVDFHTIVKGLSGAGSNTMQGPGGSTFIVSGAQTGLVFAPGQTTGTSFTNIQNLLATGGAGGGPGGGSVSFRAISPGDSIYLSTSELRSGSLTPGSATADLPLLIHLSGFNDAFLAGNAMTTAAQAYTIDLGDWATTSTALIEAAPGVTTYRGNGLLTTLQALPMGPATFTVNATGLNQSADGTLGSGSGSGTFFNIGVLQGRSGDDTFVIEPGVAFGGTVEASAIGTNTLQAPAGSTWNVTGVGSGTVALPGGSGAVTTFSGIQSLDAVGGGSLVFTALHPGDSVYLSDGELQTQAGSAPPTVLETLAGFTAATLAGNPDTPAGTTYAIWASDWSPTLRFIAAPGTATLISNIDNTANTTLQATPLNYDSAFLLNANNGGGTLKWVTLDGQTQVSTFSHVGHLQGATGSDTFTVGSGIAFAGTVGGGSSNNTFLATDGTNTWTLTGIDAGTFNATSFSNIQNIVGGSGAETFVGYPGLASGAPLLHGTLQAGVAGGPATRVSGYLTTGGSQTFNAPVTLAGDTTATSLAGSILFADTVDGAASLRTVTSTAGTTTFSAAIGSHTPLATLTTGSDSTSSIGGTGVGMTNLPASVTTTGTQNYDGPTASGDLVLTSTAGDVNATHAGNLFSGTLTVAATNLTLANAQSLSLVLDVRENASLIIQGALELSGALGSLDVTSDAAVTLGDLAIGGTANIIAGSSLPDSTDLAVLQTGAALAVGGPLAIDASGHSVDLARGGNNLFNTVAVANGYDISLASPAAFSVDAVQVAHTLSLASQDTITLTGPVSGAGRLTVAGPGSVQITTAQPYTGGTTIAAGTLTLDGPAATAGTVVGSGDGQAIAVGVGGTLDVRNGASVVNPIQANGGTIANLAGTGTLSGTVTMNADTTFSVAPSAGGLTVAATLAASADGIGVTIAGGGTTTAGAASTLTPRSTFSVDAGSTLALSSSQTVGGIAGAGTIDLQGHVLTTGANNASPLFSGSLTSSDAAAAGALTKIGTGAQTLAGVDTYVGATTVQAGRLVLSGSGTTAGDAGALANASPVTVAPGAILEIAKSEAVNAINGSAGGTIQVDGGQVLTLGSDGPDVQLDARIVSDGALAKAGRNVLTLTADNSYTGGTTIDAGVLQVGNGGASGMPGSGAIANGAVLRIDRSDAFTLANAVTDGPAGAPGELDQLAGQLTLSNPGNSYNGATHVVGGTLSTAGAGMLPNATAVTVDPGATLRLVGDQKVGSIQGDGAVHLLGSVVTQGDQDYAGGLFIDAASPVQLSAANLTATATNSQIGAQPLSITATSATLASGQALTLGAVSLAQGGKITAPTLELSGKLDVAGGSLTLTATAPVDPTQARPVASGLIPNTTAKVAIAAPTVTQDAGSAITVNTGAQLNVVTASGSVDLTQSSNQFNGGLAVLSGSTYDSAWLPNVHGTGAAAMGVQSAVNIAGDTVVIAGGGVEADIINITANTLSTQGGAQITARLPFDNVTQGTSLSVPALTLTLGADAFKNLTSFGGGSGGSSQPINVAIGSMTTGSRTSGFNDGYMTVLPKDGANGQTQIRLVGPAAGIGTPAYRFLYDGASVQSDIPVFYNGVLPQTPQVAGAVAAVAATAEQERRKRFEETVRTENVTARLRSGVIAEVGPGRPATVGTEGAAPPPQCESAAGSPLACGAGGQP